jgi:hypothetical protein
MRDFGWFIIIAGAVILEVVTAPGTSLSGQSWKLSRSGAPGMVHFTVERSRAGSRSVNGSDVPIANFRGFSVEKLDHSGPLQFEYVQDAGRLSCQGRVSWGRASGNFTLSPNPDFVAELNRLGFGSPREDQLFFLMLANVNLEYARAIHDAGLGASLQQLIELRQHGLSAQFVRDAGRAGYRNFRAQEFIDLKDHGVESGFLRDLKSAGYDMRADEIVELRDHGVSSQFLDELKQAGYNLSAGQITELSAQGVNSGFVRDLKFYGLRPGPQELVALRTHGVTAQYLRALQVAGYDKLPADEVIDLQQHGVPADFALAARDLGYRFTTGELIELRDHGVDAAYLRRLHDSGMRNLTGPQITQLRAHGVD